MSEEQPPENGQTHQQTLPSADSPHHHSEGPIRPRAPRCSELLSQAPAETTAHHKTQQDTAHLAPRTVNRPREGPQALLLSCDKQRATLKTITWGCQESWFPWRHRWCYWKTLSVRVRAEACGRFNINAGEDGNDWLRRWVALAKQSAFIQLFVGSSGLTLLVWATLKRNAGAAFHCRPLKPPQRN